MYIKNTNQTEEAKLLSFWLSSQSGAAYSDTRTKWAKDLAGINGTSQTIADIYTAPTNVVWSDTSPSEPASVNIGTLKVGEYIPIWIWRHVDANATSRVDDGPLFTFALTIPGEGSGSGGGGGGGSGITLDTFGVRQLFKTKTGGKEWFSTAWANGQARTLNQDDYDPTDSQLGYTNGSGVTTMEINGDGTATFPTVSTSHRVWVNGPWTNVEMTVYVRKRTAITGVGLRSRSNHHGVGNLPYGLASSSPQISCGFGGYIVGWNLQTDFWVANSVEVIHDLYKRFLDMHDSPEPVINTWTGYKQITRTVGTTVNVQGYINYDVEDQNAWTKESEFTYTGDNIVVDPTGFETNVSTCLDQGDKISGELNKNSLWLNPGKWCWLRLNDADDVDLQFFSVREIDPGTSTGGGGTGGDPLPTPTNWKMAVAGDWGCGGTTNSVINLCKQYDFTLGVGDNAYSGASCWTSAFAVLKPKLNSAYGNHEYSESGGIAPYKTYFGHNKTYFSFDFQNVHILVLDSNINADPGSAQHDFAVADLAAADNNSAIDWIFATFHHPMFGASSSHSYNDANMVQNYHSLFQTHKVGFVFCGHNHNWQMSKQVSYNSGSPTNPTVFSGTAPFVATTSGLIHIVSGTGGHDSGGSLYSLGSQPSFQYYQNRTHNGIFELVASNNGKTLTCSFVDKDGTKFNTFVITT